MLLQRLSVRATLTGTIVVMGLLGLALALVTGEVYRRQALDNQRDSLVGLIGLKSRDLLQELDANARTLGLAMQHDTAFREAYDRRDRVRLQALLDNQFHQYFSTAEVLRLERFQVYDTDFTLVAESTEGEAALPAGQPVCPSLAVEMRGRQGHARLQPASTLCVQNGRAHTAIMVPIGGLRPAGYLQIVCDPQFNLAAMEAELGMPVRIALPSGQITFKSKGWPESGNARDQLRGDYTLLTQSGDKALTLSLVSDVRPLRERLATTRILVMLTAGLVTLAMAMVALYIARRSALRPLVAIQDQVRNVRNSISSLRDSIGSTAGVVKKTRSRDEFTSLTSEMRTLHSALQTMALSDTLTGLPNRLYLRERLDQLASGDGADHPPFAVLVMDLDRFKQVNDAYGHDVGDQLLQQAASRLAGCLRLAAAATPGMDSPLEGRGYDFVARIGGDEFAAILPRTAERPAVEIVVQRMIAAFGRPFTIGDRHFDVGISIGVAQCPQDGADAATILQFADRAMYDAKQRRCGYAFFADLADRRKAV
jgi:diguanylate cyclase (GGDEF)-like protein